MIVLLVIVGLLVVNAFFVTAEFAVIGVSRVSVTTKANKGDSMARRVLALLTSPVRQDRFIATAQLGITLASLGLGMYGEHSLAAWLEPRLDLGPTARLIASHTLASILAVAALTYLHILLGETVPKAVALSRPERAARLAVLADDRDLLRAVSNRADIERHGQSALAAGRHSAPAGRIRSGLQP